MSRAQLASVPTPSCPECRIPLSDMALSDGVTIDFCDECKGIWLDEGELNALTNRKSEAQSSVVIAKTTAICPRCPTVSLIEVSFVKLSPVTVLQCPNCSGNWLRKGQLEQTKNIASQTSQPAAISKQEDSKSASSDEAFSFQSLTVNATALPLAFLFAWLSKILFLPAFLLDFFALLTHELGHATAAWVSGYGALPMFYGVTYISASRSSIVLVAMGLVSALLIYCAAKYRVILPAIAAVILLVAEYRLGLKASHDEAMLAFSFAGVGGQFYLSAFAICAFYYPLPKRTRWDFWRFAVLVAAAYVFFDAFQAWHNIELHRRSIPWGSLLNGRTDSGGDMNRLSDDYLWNTTKIVNTYMTLARYSLAVIALHYVKGVTLLSGPKGTGHDPEKGTGTF